MPQRSSVEQHFQIMHWALTRTSITTADVAVQFQTVDRTARAWLDLLVDMKLMRREREGLDRFYTYTPIFQLTEVAKLEQLSQVLK